jgi:hypothetical protein
MRHASIVLAASLSLWSLGAIAQEAPASTPAAAEPAESNEERAPGAVPVDKSEVDAKSAKESEEDTDKYFKRLGYSKVMKNGEAFYCRPEAALGTRLAKKVCITAEVANDRREAARTALGEHQQGRGKPND